MDLTARPVGSVRTLTARGQACDVGAPLP
ncbi:Protein of unknown function [Propionibacterium freudenreichii]|nr:Protein of unknown function [Propionibacterium freudenreichii]CEH06579.1 Protein of unknown function [Propionibacterium freudenreichii]CEI22553.1 Protein of unknown function [Propionibacterium freudenreichii]CEI29647.1 Protein of unknown function [Propionibacterium freudenreichii]